MKSFHPHRSTTRGGYSLLEVLITVLIIHMISGMIMLNVSSVQTSEKLSRAGQDVVQALRYARALAMASGQNTGVEFDTTTNRVRVFQGASATTVGNSMMPGGTYVMDFGTQNDAAGVRITGAVISNDLTNPYQIIFGKLGGTLNNGNVTLSYGSQSKTVQIPLVGDAQVQ